MSVPNALKLPSTPTERAERLWLWFVVLAGAALRLAELWMPLTHDELSAIVRLRYDTLGDVLTYGVKLGDTHPAGMQLLLWLWSQVVGVSAPLLRLPFTLLSIASIPLIYSIGRRWFGHHAGLAAATVLAFSQYSVYYAMLIRPYNIGLVLVLAMLHFWTRLCVEHRDGWGHVAGFALCAAACAYTHYFCGLTAALLGVAGLVVVPRRLLWHYVAACTLAILLFVPHLGITLHHLFVEQGVGGWLAKPEPVFVWRYLRYLTHFSWLALAVLMVAWAAMADWSLLRVRWPLATVAASVFVVPFAAGYIYSRAVDPVLQYSVLIFSWPFLVLAASALVGAKRRWRSDVAIAACGVVLGLTLFTSRRNYDVASREYIEAAASLATEARARYGAANVELAMQISPDMMEYYDSATAHDMRNPDNGRKDYALVCKVFDDVLAAKMREYPYVVEARMCTCTPVLLLSRHPADGHPYPTRLLKTASATVDDEYTMLLDTLAADIADNRHFAISTVAWGGDTTMMLVMETSVRGHCVDWRAIPMGDTVYLPLCQNLNIKSRAELGMSRIKVFVWSPRRRDGTPVNCRITTAEGNPYQYAVTEEI